MNEICRFVVVYNIDLNISYVRSGSNLADVPSRSFNSLDTMLSEKSWSVVESYFEPHYVDLMSLNANDMRSTDGKALKHLHHVIRLYH